MIPPEKQISQVRNEDASDLVYSFFEMDAFGSAIKESGFSQQERVKSIVELIRGGDDTTKLNALKEFRTVANEVLTVNGAIVAANQQSSDGDTTKTLSAKRLVKRLAFKNQETTSGEGSAVGNGTQSFLPPSSSVPSLDPPQGTGDQDAPAREAGNRRDYSGPQRLD